jgi:hypothetical protein
VDHPLQLISENNRLMKMYRHLVRNLSEADMELDLDKPLANVAFGTLGSMLFISPSMFHVLGGNFECVLALAAGTMIFILAALPYKYSQYIRDIIICHIAIFIMATPILIDDEFKMKSLLINWPIGSLLLLTSGIDIWKRRAK